MTTWLHKKSGALYEVLDDSAGMQCSAAREFEEIFEDVRPTEEFLDGRFERQGEDET